MTNKPNVDVSVVIPAFNAEGFIAKALQSVMEQTVAPKEIIVVDDGSTDRTATVLRAYPQIRYVYQDNSGAAAARNRGVAEAAGRWIAFLDADDVWKGHHLAGLTAIVDNHALVWACGLTEIVNVNGKPAGYDESRWLPMLREGALFDSFFLAYALNAPFYTDGMLIRCDILRELGGFDTSYTVGEDLDLWFRIAHTFPEVGVLRPPSVVYRRRAGSLSQAYGDRAETFLRLLKAHQDLSRTEGQESAQRFQPASRKLARLVLSKSLRDGDCVSLESLLADDWQLPGMARLVGWMALRWPGFIGARNDFIKLGVRLKSRTRELKTSLKVHLPS